METAFSVIDLEFTYPKAKNQVINGISFDVCEGEIFGLLGPSGAGKSTVQKILTKLLTDYDGRISYFGEDLKSLSKEFYEYIGVGFELPVSFGKLTAIENLKFFSSLYKNQVDYNELLKRVDLYSDRNKKVCEFSKGMKMRLNFVRALLNNPKILFLDEVTNGLDPKNSKIIKDMILEFKENGGTVFLTTHLMGDVEQLCDRVAFLVDGRIAEISTPRELKQKYGRRELIVEYKEDKNIKSQTFDMNKLGDNQSFLTLLKEKHIETLHSGETSLEDIFIIVAGMGL
ncbi:MAG: ABC transporter ATP-binding protein [Clostridia bacterium]|jgi:fluoroquinolone transport system ATP-binding protein|nr:ABC transporter ATP-binding protein [Clostridia bacterium]MDD4275671.1 ABC transporter ATP-binding protein [Clostridia bacterium]